MLKIRSSTCRGSNSGICPDVRKIIHWGPSQDVEQYLQETERAGRDGKESMALLYVADLVASHAEPSMKDYYKNSTACRRQFLLKSFESGSDCEQAIDDPANGNTVDLEPYHQHPRSS